MCDRLEFINTLIHSNPPAESTVLRVFNFVTANKQQFRGCSWDAVSGPYDEAVKRLFDIMRQGPLESAWEPFVKQWDVLYTAIKYGCCRESTKWRIAQTRPDGEWGGRAICAPASHPENETERLYESRGTCEMALQLLSPQEPAVPVTSYVTCNETGCSENVSWSRRPSR